MRAWKWVAIVALCLPLPVLAASAMDKRLIELRDDARLYPDRTLVQLLELQPLVRAEPPRTQAELLAQISNAHRYMNQLDAAAATAEQVIAYGKQLADCECLRPARPGPARATGSPGAAAQVRRPIHVE